MNKFQASSVQRVEDELLLVLLFRRSQERAWRLPVFIDFRLVTQDSIQQRAVNFYPSIVADETLFTELVHEEADARSGGPDHFRQGFLRELRNYRIRLTRLAKFDY